MADTLNWAQRLLLALQRATLATGGPDRYLAPWALRSTAKRRPGKGREFYEGGRPASPVIRLNAKRMKRLPGYS